MALSVLDRSPSKNDPIGPIAHDFDPFESFPLAGVKDVDSHTTREAKTEATKTWKTVSTLMQEDESFWS